MKREKPLRHVVVAEIGHELFARYCGRLLADLGARVVRVSESESMGGPQRLPWLDFYLDHGKATAPSIADAVAPADVVLLDAEQSISDVRCHAIVGEVQSGASRQVVAVMGAFGATGPNASFAGVPLTAFHAGGEGFLLPGGARYVDFPPTQPTGFVAAYDTGVAAATAVIAGLVRRRRTGSGALVDVSAQEAVMSLNRPTWIRFRPSGVVTHRYDHGYAVGGVLPCRDGWVTVLVSIAQHWQGLLQVLNIEALADDPRFATRESREKHGQALNEIFVERLSHWDKEQITRVAQKAHVPIASFCDLAEVLNSDQLASRGFFCDVEDGRGKRVKVPQFPATFHYAPSVAAKELPSATSGLPLSGVRVADLSWVLAGPHASMTLGLLGADVIKIESSTRPDSARMMEAIPGVTQGGVEASAGFVSVNMNKRSVTLNLKEERGRDLARKIFLNSDIVLDNFAPGAMARLGFDHDQLLKSRPDLICASVSTYGSSGPKSHYVGYAPLFNALSGMGHMVGYPDMPPGEIRAGADLRAGAMCALAIVAALESRCETGRGMSVDVSATEVLSGAIAEEFVRAQWDGDWHPRREGNRMPDAAPHSCYPCSGEDNWLSIAIRDDSEWEKLCTIAGQPEWSKDPRFETFSLRLEHEAALDEAIGGWTISHDAWELTRQLQAAGIAAFPSANALHLDRDEHLRTRAIWEQVHHPRIGRVQVMGAHFMIDGERPPVWTAAPLLGEHNEEVLRDLLGLSEEDIRSLVSESIVC